jgi:hypothetical protein
MHRLILPQSSARPSSSSGQAPPASPVRSWRWHPVVAVDQSRDMLELIDEAETVLRDIECSLLRGEMEYVVDAERLFHIFEACLRTEAQIAAELEASGLHWRGFLDEAGSWIEAVPIAS